MYSRRGIIDTVSKVYKKEYGALSEQNEQGCLIIGVLIEALDELDSKKVKEYSFLKR